MLVIERLGGKHTIYERLPVFVKTALTFVIICFTWVFFRAPDLPTALEYRRSMFGLGTPQPGPGLIGGLIYQPYYVVSMLLAAILQFHRQRADRNIQLVIMPIPDKATMYPEKFSSSYEGQPTSVHNPSYRQSLGELEAEGVLVCDVTDALAQYRDRSRSAVNVATDTHWRPEAMELAAAELARLIEERIGRGTTAGSPLWSRASKDVKTFGDLVMMLKLPQNQAASAAASAGQASPARGFTPQTAASASAEETAQPETTLSLVPLGVVKRSGGRTFLVIDKKYAPGLVSVGDFSHTMVFYWCDKNDTPAKRAFLQGYPV